jgi:hypothetical protein
MTAQANRNIDIAQKQLDACNGLHSDVYVSSLSEDCVMSGLNPAKERPIRRVGSTK